MSNRTKRVLLVEFAFAQGAPDHPPCVLSHPLEDLRPVLANHYARERFQPGYGGWEAEDVVWTSDQAHHAVTYNQVFARRDG
jgi:hypothetical protein